MANTATTKDGKSLAYAVRDEDLQELEGLKRDLLDKCDRARDGGSLYLMSQYTRLVALVSPEIKRIRDRFDRETLASVRKEEKALKQQVRNAVQAEKEAEGRA
ncbi:MAG: hypothetical protein ACRDHZ_10645 [Ktedonobacteraceae bacterium]